MTSPSTLPSSVSTLRPMMSWIQNSPLFQLGGAGLFDKEPQPAQCSPPPCVVDPFDGSSILLVWPHLADRYVIQCGAQEDPGARAKRSGKSVYSSTFSSPRRPYTPMMWPTAR